MPRPVLRPVSLRAPGRPRPRPVLRPVPLPAPAQPGGVRSNRVASTTRVVPTTGRTRRAPAVYLRRRLVLATVATLAVLGAIRLSPGFSGGGPLAASGEPGSDRPAAALTYVVRPGDTIWSIAHHLVPRGDERPMVDAITQELHGTSLAPGEAIPIP